MANTAQMKSGDAGTSSPHAPAVDWYERREDLRPEQVFRLEDGSLVMLDRTVPGDGTRWYVAQWYDGWFYEDSTIEPGELVELLDDDAVARLGGGQ